MDRTYDLFEKLPNGDLLWRCSVSGLEAARQEVVALARRSGNECVLMHLVTQEVVARITSAGGNSL